MVPDMFSEAAGDELSRRAEGFPSARWLTWSPEFLETLRRHASLTRRMRVRLVTIAERREYSYTYTLPLREHGALCRELRRFANGLLRFDPGDSLVFFSSMDCRSAGWRLHLVFAALREAIRSETDNEWAALYAPLSNTGNAAVDFPLHADLYRPSVLFNLFENVPSDGSGRTVLLPIEELFAAIDRGLTPARAGERLKKLLTEPLPDDGYTEFYDLLHGKRHDWTRNLGRHLASRQRSMFLGAYEGYLLHDRRWLHGRELPSGGVPKNRLRRLIYQPTAG
jgi:hypothetical protein